LSWTKTFASLQGYYVRLDTIPNNPPSGASGQFVATDSTTFPASALATGNNYFHITPIDQTSNVGTVESVFHVTINSTPPSLSSPSHPDQSAWSTNMTPNLNWSFPQG